MPRVAFTRHLQTFFPALKMSEEVRGATVREVIDELEKRYPGFALYVADETGRLRRHVNVYVDRERAGLDTPLQPNSNVRVIAAISGG